MICHVTTKKVLTNGTTVFEDVGTLFPGRGGRKGGGRGEEGGRGGWMRKIFKASNLREIQAGKQFKTTRLYITTSNAYMGQFPRKLPMFYSNIK